MIHKWPLLAGGILLSLTLSAEAAVRYVDLNSPSPTSPYTNWTTAATNIQDAIDVAANGDLVLVTNGVYATGGRQISRADVTNRVSVTNGVIVQSVNGPAFTFIQGYQVSGTVSLTNAVRCAFLASNAVLSGFTLTNGSAGTGNYINGGGISCGGASAIVSNCVLIGNYAAGGGGAVCRGTLIACLLSGNRGGGGGAAIDARLINCTITNNLAGWAGGTLGCAATNCLLAWNHATNYGGASGFSTLVNCTLVSNSLQPGYGGNGGGSRSDTLFNCILYDNTAPNGPNYSSSSLSYSCTTPLPSGPGNFTNAPLFADPGAGNLRLQSRLPLHQCRQQCLRHKHHRFGRHAPPGEWDGGPRGL